MENVLITPHLAGMSPHQADRVIALFVENLRRYQSGRELINLVDKKAGY
jgi:phosphoglycerate dehydrogenase-like enzyme